MHSLPVFLSSLVLLLASTAVANPLRPRNDTQADGEKSGGLDYSNVEPSGYSDGGDDIKPDDNSDSYWKPDYSYTKPDDYDYWKPYRRSIGGETLLRPTDNSTAHYALTASNPKRGNGIFYIARCDGDGSNNNYDRGVYYSNWQNSLKLEHPTYTSTSASHYTEDGEGLFGYDMTGPTPYNEAAATIWNYNPGWYQIGGRATIESQYDCRMDNGRALYYDNGNPCWSLFYCQ
ncbi:hypothetical protein FRB93_012265 [Tulasnella sp. JGI-2019a]|nr:hypothetical protein FRB93_012265 [Tulasnella sp. JGI-2019a]